MASARPYASVSLDLDNLWSYLKTHGDAGWEARPTYLPVFVPIALDALRELDARITFFVVGVDADQAVNRDALLSIAAAGHEIGNHSYEHEPWLHRYAAHELETELDRAEEALGTVSGSRPTGFRGPGYSWSPALLESLHRRGYTYDASTLPTFIGPLARFAYFRSAKLTAAQRAERAYLFGSWRNGLLPNDSHRLALGDDRSILEIPVTVVPGVRAPFHVSYLLWLAHYSERAMWAYYGAALTACRLAGIMPSLILHPLDLLGGDLAPSLRFFPGMHHETARKRDLFGRILQRYRDHFEIVTMAEHARRAARESLPVRDVARSFALQATGALT